VSSARFCENCPPANSQLTGFKTAGLPLIRESP